MKILNAIKAWLGDREGAVRGCVDLLSGRERHYGCIVCMVGIQVHDKTGKEITSFERISHSFTQSAFQNLSSIYTKSPAFIPAVSIRDLAGVLKTSNMVDLDAVGDWADAPDAAVDDYGVLVGTSATAWAWAQYVLQAKIAHGNGAGELAYGACSVSDVEDTGLPAKLTLQRSFDNNSGAEITVREIGWFGTMKTEPAVFAFHMIARDVITATTVPNGGRLTVKYTILINPT